MYSLAIVPAASIDSSVPSSPLIAPLVPGGVAVAELRDGESPEPLRPAEREAVGGAVSRRRHEFALGRTCARRALRAIDHVDVDLLPGPARSPGWPPGVVGSITHCRGYTAAAVARSGQVMSIGIDAEPRIPLPAGVLDRVAYDGERAWLRARTEPGWDRTLFSAKESVYKAWYPISGRWLDFEDVAVQFDQRRGTFVAELRRPSGAPVSVFHGRYRHVGGLILTAVVVPPGLDETRPASAARLRQTMLTTGSR